jgi:hypothetical protein
MSDRSHDLDYKRENIEQRPSFYSNHVLAIVGKLYSKKDFIVESTNRSTTGGRIKAAKCTVVTLYTTGERKGTQETHFRIL